MSLTNQGLNLHPASVMRKQQTSITPWQQIVCSCSGALVTSCFTTPLDVLKVRLQAQETMVPSPTSCFNLKHTRSLMESFCLCTHCNDHLYKLKRNIHPLAAAKPQFFKGMHDIFINIVQKEGVTSLWSGLPATLLMALPATVVYFTTYDQLKYRMGYKECEPSTFYIPMLAGCLARMCAATLISPLELVRTKMQSTRLSYRQLIDAIRISVQHNGFRFLMTGLGPSLLRDVPFSAIYWLGYESIKSYYMRKYETSDPGTMTIFLGGAVSGTIAAVLTLPFDVVKTHRQMELGQATSLHSKKLPSTWGLLKQLYRRRGVSAVFAGIAPRIIKAAPACAIMITIYESGKSFFRSRNNMINNSDGLFTSSINSDSLLSSSVNT